MLHTTFSGTPTTVEVTPAALALAVRCPHWDGSIDRKVLSLTSTLSGGGVMVIVGVGTGSRRLASWASTAGSTGGAPGPVPPAPSHTGPWYCPSQDVLRYQPPGAPLWGVPFSSSDKKAPLVTGA